MIINQHFQLTLSTFGIKAENRHLIGFRNHVSQSTFILKLSLNLKKNKHQDSNKHQTFLIEYNDITVDSIERRMIQEA